ncbi:uncharacterized protein ISCGN_031577 [Ixodes scapularis]
MMQSGTGEAQQQAFEQTKTALITTPALAMYNPREHLTLSVDASSYGLGAVLLQESQGERRPVAYAYRVLTETEQRYAQIEKEALAITWARGHFRTYLLGLQFHIETNHKPLVPLLATKRLDEPSPRLQHFRMRLLEYDFTISHILGKEINTANVLSNVGSSLTALTSSTKTSLPTRVHGSCATCFEGKGKMDVLMAKLRLLRKHNKRLQQRLQRRRHMLTVTEIVESVRSVVSPAVAALAQAQLKMTNSSSPGQLISEGEPTLASSSTTGGPTSWCHTHRATEQGSCAACSEDKGKMDVLRAKL